MVKLAPDLVGRAWGQVDPVGSWTTHRVRVGMTLTLIGDRDLDGLGRVPGHLDPAFQIRQLFLNSEAKVVQINASMTQVVGLFPDILSDSSCLGY